MNETFIKRNGIIKVVEVKMIIKENSVFGILKDIGITRIVIKEGNKSVTVVKDPLV